MNNCAEQEELLDALESEYLQLLELEHEYQQNYKAWEFKAYPWQRKLWMAGKNAKQRMLMAANQVGKTQASCIELVYHVTGIYPDDWPGHKFDHPITAWALGVSAEQMKKVLQSKILGKIIDKANNFTGGMIPNDLIINESVVKGQFKDSVKEVKIKWGEDGATFSMLYFLSYEQGQAVLMGEVVDFALIDEEPRDATIYPQVLIRTINGDNKKGGRVLLSFTPEWGTTELVYQFTEKLQDGQFFQTATWDDAPHFTEERKKQMLAALPDHQKDLRSKGIPPLGSGRVYPYNESEIKHDFDVIPAHWPRLCAMDFGTKNLAFVWMAWNRDNDLVYVYDAIKLSKVIPEEVEPMVNGRGKWINVMWPHDGRLPGRTSGIAQMQVYKDAGINMFREHATDANGSIAVEAGVMRLNQRMRNGTLKVSSHLTDFFEEFRLYHRKDGKIVKANDHLMDAMRYGEMMLRHATVKEDGQQAAKLQLSFKPKLRRQ